MSRERGSQCTLVLYKCPCLLPLGNSYAGATQAGTSQAHGVHTDDALRAAPEYKSEERRTPITLSCWVFELYVCCDGHPLIPTHFCVALTHINFQLEAVTEIKQTLLEYIKLFNGRLSIFHTQGQAKGCRNCGIPVFNYEVKVFWIIRWFTKNTLLPPKRTRVITETIWEKVGFEIHYIILMALEFYPNVYVLYQNATWIQISYSLHLFFFITLHVESQGRRQRAVLAAEASLAASQDCQARGTL